MKTCGKWPIGACSWSFQKSVGEIGTALAAMDVDGVQLALLPALKDGGEKYLEEVAAQNWRIQSTMLNFDWEDYTTLDTIRVTGGIAPDAHWDEALRLFKGAAALTKKLGAPYLMLHAGFLDHADAAYAKKFTDRVRALGDVAAENGIVFIMETGQETAEELQRFLEDLAHPAVAVNLDPANLILYNKDEPVNAVKRLAPWIRHVHVKDGVRTTTPGTWGAEVPWGDGDVNPFVFLNALEAIGFDGCLAVEREAGTRRVADIALAVRRLAAR